MSKQFTLRKLLIAMILLGLSLACLPFVPWLGFGVTEFIVLIVVVLFFLWLLKATT